jgi:peptidoglycan/LPS O-acetylase OafA/YrhL
MSIHPSTARDLVSKDFNVSRISSLDGVRGIAFLMVFSCHTGILQTGHFGVDLFFVLSGFLITSILLQENKRTGSISFWRFYMRRALRLLPALFGVVLFVLAYTIVMLPFSKFLLALSDSWRIALYIWNWTLSVDAKQIVKLHQEMFTHLWSLSVEEQFYIAWPFLLVIMLKVPRSIVLTLLILGMVIPGVARWLISQEGPELWMYFRTDFRFDNLLYGAMVAWLLHWGFEPKGLTRKILSWAGLFSLIGMLALARYELIGNGAIYHGILSLVALLSALLIASAI